METDPSDDVLTLTISDDSDIEEGIFYEIIIWCPRSVIILCNRNACEGRKVPLFLFGDLLLVGIMVYNLKQDNYNGVYPKKKKRKKKYLEFWMCEEFSAGAYQKSRGNEGRPPPLSMDPLEGMWIRDMGLGICNGYSHTCSGI